jgi:hypothetical protein
MISNFYLLVLVCWQNNQTGSTLTDAFYPVNKFLHIQRFAQAGRDVAAHSFLQFRMEGAARKADDVYPGVLLL